MPSLDGFNANEVEPSAGFEPIPDGEYTAVIVHSETKPTKRGDGEYLKLEFQIVGPRYENRIIWEQLNIWNPSAKAVEIAKGTLSAICRAVGVLTPKQSSDLHNIPLLITVRTKQSPGYDPQNKITGFKAVVKQTPNPAPPGPRKAGPNKVAATTRDEAGSVVEDDEIPF